MKTENDNKNTFSSFQSQEDQNTGCVFTSTIVSLNIPEGVLFTDFVKRLKNGSQSYMFELDFEFEFEFEFELDFELDFELKKKF